VWDSGEFPIVLGGDCSILLGSALALKRRGRFGLLFIDGHADFHQPEAEPNGEAASMDLALATGYGPLLSSLEGRGPLIRSEDAVAFGFRDGEDQARYGSQPLPPDLLALDLHAVRRLGIVKATGEALTRLRHEDIDRFFVHLDSDSLDDRIMPAVDYRLDDGFGWEEMRSILTAALSSGRAVGFELTIYNPALDAGGKAGRALTAMLASAFGTRIRSPLLRTRYTRPEGRPT
jgi:arginase